MAVAQKIEDPTDTMRTAITGVLRDTLTALGYTDVPTKVWYRTVPENVSVGFPRAIYNVENDRSQAISNSESAGILSTVTSALWSPSPAVSASLGSEALPRLTDRENPLSLTGWRVVWPDLITEFDRDVTNEDQPDVFGRIIRTQYQLVTTT